MESDELITPLYVVPLTVTSNESDVHTRVIIGQQDQKNVLGFLRETVKLSSDIQNTIKTSNLITFEIDTNNQ